MPPKDPKLRNLTIKSGVVKRLSKEKVMYEKEFQQHEEKIETMKKEEKDEYDIKKMIEVKNESAAMIPDCTRRLQKAQDELAALLEEEKSLAETEEYKTAESILKDAKEQVAS
ncbi:tubulin-specific chaperone A-like [Hydractinia symbiolongicarpus]|uniref:tubulin-specific chaperone A-like n=1 Tax=Hydractinia symbiolongicarpus TaxID=13093 RepID=UPI002550AB54|nr:tubulin-specific chaperone A-like [Hydractinia symbiolongicarpus]